MAQTAKTTSKTITKKELKERFETYLHEEMQMTPEQCTIFLWSSLWDVRSRPVSITLKW